MSHLFAQGLVSAELYLDDQRFRDGAAELLERLGASADMLSRERPNPGEWEVAYVVLTRGVRKDTPYTLPFFSLANLASSARRLQDRGFKVSIAEVREV
ncbi:MAG: TIGR04141 family sporadically distributed protein [Thermoleophilia bacterium]|nr:TIGR04141 family sporadically distributed protein [Thermoleophilia bacterium]